MHHPDPNEKSSQQRMVKKDAVMRRLLAATLSVSSLWQLMPLTATAQVTPPTAAGTTINNTATGTYVDPNNPGTPINTTSNTVTATVAEIAGVTNVRAGTVDLNGGSVTVNDGLDFPFLITNVGNDPTAFHIPTTATIVGGTIGTDTSNVSGVAASILPAQQRPNQILVTAINGVNLPTAVPLPVTGNPATDGFTTEPTFVAAIQALGGVFATFDGSVPAGGSIKVVVPVKVTETQANQPVSVQLGDTGANDNSAGTQNQPDNADALGQANEVYTVNVAPGTPVNGAREAAAKDTQTLAVQINNLALATVLKTRTAYSPGPTTALTDDTLTYRLDLRVENSTSIPNTATAPLLPTAITLDNVAANRILVSDAIPAFTQLDPTFGAPTVTIGTTVWTRVHSLQPLAVTPTGAGQNWLTTAPTPASTRIGYIANGPIDAGTTTTGDGTGFQFRVTTTGIPVGGGTVANIAQVFGQTTAGPISPTNPLVYDESGDPYPNNYEGTTPPTPITTPQTSPDGVANITADGVDTNNDNAGDGSSGGEDNIFTINPPGIILNGPLDQPGAIGPDTTNNTDFVNKSAVDVPANAAPGSTYNPAPIKFSNSVANPSSNTDKLDNVILEPISAAAAVAATGKPLTAYELASAVNGDGVAIANNGAPLINGTTVRIAFPVGSTPTGTGRTALYTLTAGNFVLTSSTTNGAADGVAAPIKLTSLAVGEEQDYDVFVDLPAGSVVSTGYSVPIVSYVDSNPATVGFKNVAAEDNPFNIKIDRAYTGYLSLFKQSRVLVGSGPALSVIGDATLSATPKSPAPGNILEYVVTYINISTVASGVGNSILNANNIIITEDGFALTNNWGSTTTAVPSTAADPTLGAVITFFVGNTPTLTTDPAVNKYIDTIPTLAPGGTGSLTFQRQVK
jgi:hypothetical protein